MYVNPAAKGAGRTLWAKLETAGKGLEGVLAELKEFAATEVMVGIPMKTSSRKGDEINNAELGYIHTHGARRHQMRKEMQKDMDKGHPYSKAFQAYIHANGSPMFGIPPRPFLEPALDREKVYLGSMLEKATQLALEHQGAAAKAKLAKTGMEAADIVKDWFYNPANGWPALNPKTIKMKNKRQKGVGTSNPLIDTGALRNSITYELRRRGHD